MGEFRMPALGADMEAGTIVEWHVAPGQAVHRGDIVAVVDTEKSDIEVEIFEDGVVEELLVQPGVEVPVGTVLARIGPATRTPTSEVGGQAGAGERTGEAAGERAGPAEGAATAEQAPRSPSRPKGPPTRPRRPRRRREAPAPDTFVRASPRARRLAAARGIDLGTIAGSGPGGAIVTADIEASAEEPRAAATQPEAVPALAGEPTATGLPKEQRPRAERQAAMRRAIATLMARSKREIPHYYLATTVDLRRALEWLAEANAARPVTERLLPAVLLLKATALAAKEVPAMNGFFDDGFRSSESVHLGVAVALRGGGLIAPAVHDADQLELTALMAALRDLVQRARTGALRSSEMSDPTLTVTNLGELGVEEVFGVIYPPQVALVGFGKIVERPWAEGGMLGIRPVTRLTLAADHRVSDGHEGAKFLAAIDRLLQNPETL